MALGEDIELRICVAGERWFPWNYRRTARHTGDRIGMRAFAPEPGLRVINAIAADGSVLGSCALRVGYRHSEQILSDEEYQYGAGATGPPFFWPEQEGCPWIAVVKSFWVRPNARRRGVARRFAGYARDLGLPTYLAFGNPHMRAWFEREYRPTDELSPLQHLVASALAVPSEDHEPDADPDFTVYIQVEAPALLLWNAWPNEFDEVTDLEELLFYPARADEDSVDSGEVFEAGFSDSAFAVDRTYGYDLSPWCESWGPREGPYDDLPDDATDEDWDAARRAFANQSWFVAGAVEGWVVDPAAMCAYASVRHFLRTLRLEAFSSVDEAVRELFVTDLASEARGLRSYHALVAPVEPREPPKLGRLSEPDGDGGN